MRNHARWIRGLGVAMVSTFLVVGGAFAADGLIRSGNDDGTRVVDVIAPAAPAETGEPAETAEPDETAEPSEMAEPSETAEAPEHDKGKIEDATEHQSGQSGHDGAEDDNDQGENEDANDDHGDHEGAEDHGGHEDSGHDGGHGGEGSDD